MKPKPFASLNHFTVPSATELLLTSWVSRPLIAAFSVAARPVGVTDPRCPTAEHEKAANCRWRHARDSHDHGQPKRRNSRLLEAETQGSSLKLARSKDANVGRSASRERPWLNSFDRRAKRARRRLPRDAARVLRDASGASRRRWRAAAEPRAAPPLRPAPLDLRALPR